MDCWPSVLITDLYASGPHARRLGGGLQELILSTVESLEERQEACTDITACADF